MMKRLSKSASLRTFHFRPLHLQATTYLCVAMFVGLLFAIEPSSAFAQNGVPRTDVDEAFENVFDDAEFRRLQRIVNPDAAEPGWFEQFLDWLFKDSGQSSTRTTSGGGTGAWGSFFSILGNFLYWLAWGLAMTALAYVGWILTKAILNHFEERRNFGKVDQVPTAEEALDLTHPPGEIPCDEYERRAVGLSRSGDYKSAVRELVLGSMSWIERAGLIRYRRGLTNRDYVRAVWRKQTERGSLEHIVTVFERAYFGRRVPDQAAFELCLENYQRAFAREEVLVES